MHSLLSLCIYHYDSAFSATTYAMCVCVCFTFYECVLGVFVLYVYHCCGCNVCACTLCAICMCHMCLHAVLVCLSQEHPYTLTAVQDSNSPGPRFTPDILCRVNCTKRPTVKFWLSHSSKNCFITCASRLESEIRVREGHNMSLRDQHPD